MAGANLHPTHRSAWRNSTWYTEEDGGWGDWDGWNAPNKECDDLPADAWEEVPQNGLRKNYHQLRLAAAQAHYAKVREDVRTQQLVQTAIFV